MFQLAPIGVQSCKTLTRKSITNLKYLDLGLPLIATCFMTNLLKIKLKHRTFVDMLLDGMNLLDNWLMELESQASP